MLLKLSTRSLRLLAVTVAPVMVPVTPLAEYCKLLWLKLVLALAASITT